MTEGPPRRSAKPLIVGLLLLLVVGFGAFMMGRMLGPQAEHAAPASAAPASAAPAPAAVASPATPPAAASTINAALLPGIWGPATERCAGGFVVAYTRTGRWAEGDEYAGTEGRWAMDGDSIVHSATLRFERDDIEQDARVAADSRTHRTRVRSLTADRLTGTGDDGRPVDLIRCPEGRTTFLDGEVAQ